MFHGLAETVLGVEPASERQPGCQRRGVLLQGFFVTCLDLGGLVELSVGSGSQQPTGDGVGSVLVVGPALGRHGVISQNDPDSAVGSAFLYNSFM